MRAFSVPAIILLSALLLMPALPAEAQASRPGVIITLDHDFRPGAAYPDEEGDAVFHGYVTVTFDDDSPRTVRLAGFTESGWNVTFHERELHFDESGGSRRFLAIVTIPAGVPKADETVTIGGRVIDELTGEQWAIEEVTGTIGVETFYDFGLRVVRDDVAALRDSEFELKFEVTNNGNDRDKFMFQVENWERLSDQGFTVQLSHNSLELGPGESAVVTLSVSGSGLPSGDHEVTVRVGSYGSESVMGIPLQKTIELHFRLEGIASWLGMPGAERGAPEFMVAGCLAFAAVIVVFFVAVFVLGRKRRRDGHDRESEPPTAGPGVRRA